MEDLFALMTATDQGEGKTSVRLGIRVKIAGHEAICPISRPCGSYEALKKESQVIRDQMKEIEQSARSLFRDRPSQSGINIDPDMPPEEVWNILSTITDEATLVAAFNDLDASQRQAVAEYILTQCNIFSGKATIFSSRYDSVSGILQ